LLKEKLPTNTGSEPISPDQLFDAELQVAEDAIIINDPDGVRNEPMDSEIKEKYPDLYSLKSYLDHFYKWINSHKTPTLLSSIFNEDIQGEPSSDDPIYKLNLYIDKLCDRFFNEFERKMEEIESSVESNFSDYFFTDFLSMSGKDGDLYREFNVGVSLINPKGFLLRSLIDEMRGFERISLYVDEFNLLVERYKSAIDSSIESESAADSFRTKALSSYNSALKIIDPDAHSSLKVFGDLKKIAASELEKFNNFLENNKPSLSEPDSRELNDLISSLKSLQGEYLILSQNNTLAKKAIKINRTSIENEIATLNAYFNLGSENRIFPRLFGSQNFTTKFLEEIDANFTQKTQIVNVCNRQVLNEKIAAEKKRIAKEEADKKADAKKKFWNRVFAVIGSAGGLGVLAYGVVEVSSVRSKINKLNGLGVLKIPCSSLYLCSDNDLELAVSDHYYKDGFDFILNKNTNKVEVRPKYDLQKALEIVHGKNLDVNAYPEFNDSSLDAQRLKKEFSSSKTFTTEILCSKDVKSFWRTESGEGASDDIIHSLDDQDGMFEICSTLKDKLSRYIHVDDLNVPGADKMKTSDRERLAATLLKRFKNHSLFELKKSSSGVIRLSPSAELQGVMSLIYPMGVTFGFLPKHSILSVLHARKNLDVSLNQFCRPDYELKIIVRPITIDHRFSRDIDFAEKKNELSCEDVDLDNLGSAKNNFIDYLKKASIDFSEERIKEFGTIRELEQEAIELFSNKAVFASNKDGKITVTLAPKSRLQESLSAIHSNSGGVVLGLVDDAFHLSEKQEYRFSSNVSRSIEGVCSSDYTLDLIVKPLLKDRVEIYSIGKNIKNGIKECDN